MFHLPPRECSWPDLPGSKEVLIHYTKISAIIHFCYLLYSCRSFGAADVFSGFLLFQNVLKCVCAISLIALFCLFASFTFINTSLHRGKMTKYCIIVQILTNLTQLKQSYSSLKLVCDPPRRRQRGWRGRRQWHKRRQERKEQWRRAMNIRTSNFIQCILEYFALRCS